VSVRVLAWALRDAPVTNHTDLLVLIAIADHAHDDGTGAYPSVSTIASMARCGARTVENALARLQAAGVVTVQERPGKTSVYRVLVTPAARAGVTPAAGAATPSSSRQRPPQLTT
jgi:DNA-binding MarR family transcriptional regulator